MVGEGNEMTEEITKAQLILVGGRAIPNVLTILHQKPELVVAICSHQSVESDWPGLEKAIRKLHPSCRIFKPEPVDGFDLQEIQQRCEEELLKFPQAHWIFNITTATTIMSIGAYEVARKYSDKLSVQWYYLNTAGTRVVPFESKKLNEEMYFIKVQQYITAYNYGLREGTNIAHNKDRYQQKDWLSVSMELGKNFDKVALLKKVMQGWGGSPGKKKDDGEEPAKPYRITEDVSHEMDEFLEWLKSVGLLRKIKKDNDSKSVSVTLTEQQYKFLEGAWLELYAYQIVKSLDIFDNREWNKEIIDNDPDRQEKRVLQYNELDVSMTYKAQLLIIECKAGEAGAKSQTLDDIVNVVDGIGGRFVGKFLVTNQIIPDDDDFFIKAHNKRIYVVTCKDLPKLEEILREQTINPKYSRT